jgi:hypothetical protein
MLSGAHTGIAMLFEKLKEFSSVDKGQLARLYGFRCQLIRFACNNCVQAENFSRLDDTQDKHIPIMGSSRELGLPLAKQEDSARRLSLNKNGRTFQENREMFYVI